MQKETMEKDTGYNFSFKNNSNGHNGDDEP